MTQTLQGPAVTLMLQQGLDLGLENIRVKGFEQVVDGATGIAFEHGGGRLLIGAQEDDRRHAGALAAAHQARHFKAIHARHPHIQQYQVDITLQ